MAPHLCHCWSVKLGFVASKPRGHVIISCFPVVLESCVHALPRPPPARAFYKVRYQLPITKWPRQSGAPVGAAPPTRSQLRLQRHTQVPVQDSHNGYHQPMQPMQNASDPWKNRYKTSKQPPLGLPSRYQPIPISNGPFFRPQSPVHFARNRTSENAVHFSISNIPAST